jgi:hypothetical protein
MNKRPFFSDKDSELLKQGSVRDYLGLVPIWSKIARKLEPNLSGAIRSYLGLEAVLFIYYLEEEHVPETLKQNNNFREFFRYMEGLIEYYLYHYLKVEPCYGSRLLKGNGPDVEIKFSSVTTVNGLYQFYRGTCRRAGMLSKDWVLDENALSTITTLCAPYSGAINKLIQLIENMTLRGDKVIKPSEVFANKQIVVLFNILFESKELKEYIRSCLYIDKELEYYASACFSVKSQPKVQGIGSELNPVQHLKAYIDSNNKLWSHFSELEIIQDCEPFLALLDDCFQFLHLHDGRKLSVLESLLTEPDVKLAMRDKSVSFIRSLSINSGIESDRIKLLLEIAGLLAKEDMKGFLLGLLEYHRKIMKSRGAGSMIHLDGCELRVASEIHSADQNKLLKSICNESPWTNGYYINTTARIYNQLHGEK